MRRRRWWILLAVLAGLGSLGFWHEPIYDWVRTKRMTEESEWSYGSYREIRWGEHAGERHGAATWTSKTWGETTRGTWHHGERVGLWETWSSSGSLLSQELYLTEAEADLLWDAAWEHTPEEFSEVVEAPFSAERGGPPWIGNPRGTSRTDCPHGFTLFSDPPNHFYPPPKVLVFGRYEGDRPVGTWTDLFLGDVARQYRFSNSNSGIRYIWKDGGFFGDDLPTMETRSSSPWWAPQACKHCHPELLELVEQPHMRRPQWRRTFSRLQIWTNEWLYDPRIRPRW